VVDNSQLSGGQLVAKVRENADALLGELPVWLHFDEDIMDSDLMPVIYPPGDGLTYSQTEALLRTFLSVGG